MVSANSGGSFSSSHRSFIALPIPKVPVWEIAAGLEKLHIGRLWSDQLEGYDEFDSSERQVYSGAHVVTEEELMAFEALSEDREGEY